jgi:hypothetical protein
LIKELETLVDRVRFPRDYLEALLNGDLGNAMVVSVCVDAVAALHEKKTGVLSPGLR